MKYMGGKSRNASVLASIIQKDATPDQWTYDLFCGGGAVLSAMTGKRVGSDINRYTIAALQLIRDHPNALPYDESECTEEEYRRIQFSTDDDALKGYIGFTMSFGAKWFGGYARNSKGRDYVTEAFNSAAQQSPTLQGVTLIYSRYNDLPIEPNSIIYCDPPYAGTTEYKGTDTFNHAKFWEWCRNVSKHGHKVFISEYTAPDDFKSIWSKTRVEDLGLDSRRNIKTEQLFVWRDDD